MTKKTLKQSTAVVDPSIAELAKHLDEDARESGAGGGAKIFIKFSGKMDRYALGRDNDDLDLDQLFIAHPGTFTKGWACWKDRKVVDREQALVSNRASLSKFDDLEDHGPYNEKAGDGWKEERTVQLASPENPGAIYQFGMTNISGCFALADLQQACVDRMKTGRSHYPLFNFGSEEFEAQGQVNYKPTLAQNIVGWLSLEAMNAVAAGEAEIDDVMDPVAAPVKLVEPSKKKPARKPARKRR